MGAVKDSYTLELLDKILAPLKRIEAQAERVGGVMERLEKMCSSGLGMAKLAAVVGGAVLGLGALGSAMGSVLGHLSKLTVGFGSGIIAAASFRERYLTMFSHRFGAAAGKGLYNSVLDFSQVTPGTAAEMAENTARFANIGMKGKDLAAAVAAGADVQAMFGGEAGAKFGRGLTDMWSKQHLEMQDFKQSLSGVVGFDVAQAAILRLKGIKVAAEKVGETFTKLHKAGKITGREGAVGALMAVQEGPNKGKALGSFAVERGQGSLEGLISNIGEAWENLQRKVAFEDLPGMVALKDFLKRLLVYFDAATPQGRQLVAVVEKLTNTLFGGLAKIQDDDLARFFESALKMAEKFTGAIKSAWEWLDQMLHGDTSAMVAATGKAMLEVGKLLGQGIWEGFRLAFQGKEEAESKKRGGMTEGQYGALGKELGEQAVRAGEITPEIVRRGGGAEGPGMHALIEYLDKRGGLPEALASQVQGAKEHYNPGDYQGLDPGKAAEMAAEAQEILAKVGADAGKGLEGGTRKQLRSHSPSQAMAEVGEDAVDGLMLGIRRRIAQMRDGGGDDGFLDELVGALRASAARSGARTQ